jgi:hypothetical protein
MTLLFRLGIFMKRKQARTEDDTEQRLQSILAGAFSGPPTPLKDIPKRNGESRTTLNSPRKKRSAIFGLSAVVSDIPEPMKLAMRENSATLEQITKKFPGSRFAKRQRD